MRAQIGSSVEMGRHQKLLQRSDPLRLDDGTVDRILCGLSPDDAPRAYRAVAAMFAELTAPPSAAELAGERQAVTTITRRLHEAGASSRPDRSSHMSRKRRIQLAGAALVGSATLFAGLGAAGALPGAAQSVASNMLESVGVSTPSPNPHAGTHPDQRGQSGTTGADTPTTADAGSSGKGSQISGIARDDSTTGVDKGAAVSSTASNDTSQAGEHGQGPPDSAAPPPGDAGNAPVATPNPGGTPTGDTASNGNSSAGTGTAGDASGDHSTAGSGNASDGLAHQP
jgi:hypothetical protein